MSMKANVHTDSLGNITIHMKGNLNFENNSRLKGELEKLMDTNPLSKITIDMHHLDFVGSSGIGVFLQTIKLLNQGSEKIKLRNVKSEFMAVFKLHDNVDIDRIIREFDNDEDTNNLAQRYTLRKNTFQN